MEEFEPITFSITNKEDLIKAKIFREEHMRKCRKRYPDFSGTMFKYIAIPTGLGTLYVIECPCGASISLEGDMA